MFCFRILFADMSFIEGQVVFKRNSSKSVVFLDVLKDDATKVRVLCKAEICGQKVLDEIKRGSTKVHPGDIIGVSGVYNEEEKLFHCKSSIRHIEKWSEKNPKLAFKPDIPTFDGLPPKKKAKIVNHDDELVSRHQRARIFADWIVNKFEMGLDQSDRSIILNL